MKKSLLIAVYLTVFAAFMSLGSAVFSQSTTKTANMAFRPGEKLTYDGKFSKYIRGITVASLSFNVSSTPEGNFLINAEANSKGTLTKLFRFSFEQKIDSTVDSSGKAALKTVKHDVQKDRVRDSEAIFDYEEDRVTYIEVNPKDPQSPPRNIASTLNGETHDLISAIYSLRALPLEIGKEFIVKISDSGLVYEVPVKVTAKESQKSILGKKPCFKVEAQVFGPGRMIEKEGSMILWITDDAKRIPVRAQINSPVGRIEVRLRTVTNVKK